MDSKPLFVFPKWSNKVAFGVLVVLLTAPLYLGALVAYGLHPTTLAVGYQPRQPVPYSHAVHVGQLGIDCRYCHNTVEKAGFAAIPPTDTCLNCHRGIWTNSANLKPVFESAQTGDPIKWVKVHDLPDYAFFNHSAHVSAGVSCVECHGKVNHMEVVFQAAPLNMGWCLECHRDPAPRIRPREHVTNLDWQPSPQDPSTVAAFAGLEQAELVKRATAAGVSLPSMPSRQSAASAYVARLAQTDMDRLKRELGAELAKKYHVNPSTDCVTCHR